MSFEVSSGYIIVSDPGYKINQKRPLFRILRALNGKWSRTSLTFEFGEISQITYTHELLFLQDDDQLKEYFKKCKSRTYAKIGVDSGMLCICDLMKFRNDDNIRDDELWSKFTIRESGDKFYSKLCKINGKNARFIQDDIALVSGMGDGKYKIKYTEHPTDGVISIAVKFVR